MKRALTFVLLATVACGPGRDPDPVAELPGDLEVVITDMGSGWAAFELRNRTEAWQYYLERDGGPVAFEERLVDGEWAGSQNNWGCSFPFELERRALLPAEVVSGGVAFDARYRDLPYLGPTRVAIWSAGSGTPGDPLFSDVLFSAPRSLLEFQDREP